MGRARDEMIVRPDWVLFKDIVQRTLEAGARLGGVAGPLALGKGCVSGNPLGSMGDEVQFAGSTGMGRAYCTRSRFDDFFCQPPVFFWHTRHIFFPATRHRHPLGGHCKALWLIASNFSFSFPYYLVGECLVRFRVFLSSRVTGSRSPPHFAFSNIGVCSYSFIQMEDKASQLNDSFPQFLSKNEFCH